jgi:hypothetical protein
MFRPKAALYKSLLSVERRFHRGLCEYSETIFSLHFPLWVELLHDLVDVIKVRRRIALDLKAYLKPG